MSISGLVTTVLVNFSNLDLLSFLDMLVGDRILVES